MMSISDSKLNMKNQKIHSFCIGHTNIELNVPRDAYLIRTCRGFLRDDAHPNLISLGELSEELDFYYPFLGGTVGFLVVADIFEKRKVIYSHNDKIQFILQTKIVTRAPIGWKSNSYPGMMVLPPWLAKGVDVEKAAEDSEDFLFPQMVSQPGGEMNLYAHTHHLPDYLRFCAVAVDEGVITSTQVVEMCKQDILIPGGGLLGVSPLGYFLSVVESAKKVALSFLSQYRPGLFSPYQRIAVGYCIERLCSYLLIKKLQSEYGGIPREYMGYMVSVADSDYEPGSSSK